MSNLTFSNYTSKPKKHNMYHTSQYIICTYQTINIIIPNYINVIFTISLKIVISPVYPLGGVNSQRRNQSNASFLFLILKEFI